MVTPLELAVMKAFVNNIMSELFKVLGLAETYTMLRGLEQASESLRRDLSALAAAVDDEIKKRPRGSSRTAVARQYSIEMRELMHEFEDCIERFVHRVMGKQGRWWMLWPRYKFAKEIKQLKDQLKEAKERVLNLNPPGNGSVGQSSSSRPTVDHTTPNPVGIEKKTEELLWLLDRPDPVEVQAPTPQEAKVIAIVGLGGVGKTTLAKKMYHTATAVRRTFLCHVFVDVRSLEHGDADGILKTIHKKFLPKEQQFRKTSLTYFLQSRRYLIVLDDIDDIDEEQWDTIKSAIQENREGSKIVVTTTMGTTANKCRNESNGYVYKIRGLGEEDSRTIALSGRKAPELLQGSKTLLKKCDGLPLALISVAKHLNTQDEPTGARCQELCSKLGSYLDGEYEDNEANFRRLREVIMDNYTSLSDLTVRTCLLYIGIFPTDVPLNKSVIIRRWQAEGYAREYNNWSAQTVANKNFKAFIDRHIVQSIDNRNNAEVRTCKAHGIFHEFLRERCMREKFILTNLAGSEERVRHIIVHGDAGNDMNSRVTSSMDLSRVRSLTVRGNGGGAIFYFIKYKLMRVLDLEECTDVNNVHVKKICKLWNLRYLSLPNITELPKGIAKLKLLETLTVKKKAAATTLLPVEVTSLPSLVHLIGKFRLKDLERIASNEPEQLYKKSKLEILSGYVTDGRQTQGFLQLMPHMKKLRKVKIWCESTGDTNSKNDLWGAIRQYTKAPILDGSVRSLSIYSGELPNGYLVGTGDPHVDEQHLPQQHNYYLNSLKLCGDLSSWHEFITILQGLNKVCLSSITVTQDLISTLSKISTLLYLELEVIADDGIETFNIEVEAFKSLRRLRFCMAKGVLNLPKIEQGSLPELVSLHLICKDLPSPRETVNNLGNLEKLQEIGLHPRISELARKEWEEVAFNHPKRLTILVSASKVDDPVGEDSTGNPEPSAAPEEQAHVEASVSQEQAADDRAPPEPSAVQEMPLLTASDSLRPNSDMDMDSTHLRPTENAHLEEAPPRGEHPNIKYNRSAFLSCLFCIPLEGRKENKDRDVDTRSRAVRPKPDKVNVVEREREKIGK